MKFMVSFMSTTYRRYLLRHEPSPIGTIYVWWTEDKTKAEIMDIDDPVLRAVVRSHWAPVILVGHNSPA